MKILIDTARKSIQIGRKRIEYSSKHDAIVRLARALDIDLSKDHEQLAKLLVSQNAGATLEVLQDYATRNDLTRAGVYLRKNRGEIEIVKIGKFAFVKEKKGKK